MHNESLHQIHGKCHCGNIRFTLMTKLLADDLQKRKCQCTFCLKHGNVWTSVPDGELNVEINDLNKCNKYNFGHKTADFYICASCGIVPVAISKIDNNDFAVINLNTVEPQIITKDAVDFSFEEESTEKRLNRRKSSWIKNVVINI